jgi:hypothetical protein
MYLRTVDNLQGARPTAKGKDPEQTNVQEKA